MAGNLDTAKQLDAEFPTYKDEFEIPTFKSLGIESADPEADSVYFCGNSLGLMPKATRQAVNDELDAWAQRGVESHFRHPGESKGKTSWVDIDLPVVPLLAPLVGAKQNEVTCMGTLTMNLNALLCSFYRPDGNKTKILFEKSAFPSDYYAIYNLLKLRGFDPEENIIQLSPRPGEYVLRTEDIFQAIDDNHDVLALVLLPGIQYYTGQYFEMEAITNHAKLRGLVIGWDLAHAVGNVPLKLHDWNVDFAVWCSYKYLNSGPGAIGGIYVHEDYTSYRETHDYVPRLAGWWGNNSERRFQMLENFEPIESALGFRQSNPSVIDVVSLKASLELFAKVGGVDTLRRKSERMTAYLETLLKASPYYIAPEESHGKVEKKCFTIITGAQRGAQLSLLFLPHNDDVSHNVMENVNKALNKKYGIICDERRPDVIRLAPTPLYNTFQECLLVVEAMNRIFSEL